MAPYHYYCGIYTLSCAVQRKFQLNSQSHGIRQEDAGGQHLGGEVMVKGYKIPVSQDSKPQRCAIQCSACS